MKTKKPKAAKSKFSKAQAEQAHKIVNDIAEGIDGGESRKELRQALEYYADELMRTHIELVGLKHRQSMIRIGWSMINHALRDD